jgi:hypothetical protein
MTRATDSGESAGSEPGRALALHAALAEIVAQFKTAHPIVWERIRLGPTHHGIDQMIETLRG